MHRISIVFVLVVLAACSLAPAAETSQADKIIIVKSERTMTLMRGDRVLKTYRVALGTVPVGPKQIQGDHKTPEGSYVISGKNAGSRFHLALRVSYPSPADRIRARKLGASPGGDIMIHGLGREFAFLGPLQWRTDWTDGCVAVTNEEIDEIWRLVPVGTKVEIRP
jgi:murein L,D-transpeptidase YafK